MSKQSFSINTHDTGMTGIIGQIKQVKQGNRHEIDYQYYFQTNINQTKTTDSILSPVLTLTTPTLRVRLINNDCLIIPIYRN